MQKRSLSLDCRASEVIARSHDRFPGFVWTFGTVFSGVLCIFSYSILSLLQVLCSMTTHQYRPWLIDSRDYFPNFKI